VGNITRIADYFNSSNWETPIEKLVLTASARRSSGAGGRRESTGLPVTVMQNLDRSPRLEASRARSRSISPVSAARRSPSIYPGALFKAKKKEAKKKKESISLGVTILAICFLGGAGLSASAWFAYNDALDEKQELERKVSDLGTRRSSTTIIWLITNTRTT
jgi:hypothetical protein